MKYFINEHYTLYTLRKELNELCKTYHPQNGGNADTFREIMAEYYELKEKAVHSARSQRGNITQNSKLPNFDTPPAASMSLRPIINGVQILGNDEDTYALRREIPIHGGLWEPNQKRWYASRPESIKSLCEWFGLDYSIMQHEIEMLKIPTIGLLAAMVENGENVSEIHNVAVGTFNNFQSFLAYFGNHYAPALERLAAGTILQSDIVTLKNFANEMLCAFGFSTPDNQKAVQ